MTNKRLKRISIVKRLFQFCYYTSGKDSNLARYKIGVALTPRFTSTIIVFYIAREQQN
nr:MAG TPA: hypothetical protein [Caudoviricetes sp.]